MFVMIDHDLPFHFLTGQRSRRCPQSSEEKGKEDDKEFDFAMAVDPNPGTYTMYHHKDLR